MSQRSRIGLRIRTRPWPGVQCGDDTLHRMDHLAKRSGKRAGEQQKKKKTTVHESNDCQRFPTPEPRPEGHASESPDGEKFGDHFVIC